MNFDIEARKLGFDTFRKERMPVLVEFATSLGFPSPHEIILFPRRFLPSLNKWLSSQDISDDSRNWVTLRLGYYIGEYFVESHNGYWFVCEIPESRYYGQYVVGGFSGHPNAIINPMEVAWHLVNEPVDRSLENIISEITDSLNSL